MEPVSKLSHVGGNPGVLPGLINNGQARGSGAIPNYLDSYLHGMSVWLLWRPASCLHLHCWSGQRFQKRQSIGTQVNTMMSIGFFKGEIAGLMGIGHVS